MKDFLKIVPYLGHWGLDQTQQHSPLSESVRAEHCSYASGRRLSRLCLGPDVRLSTRAIRLKKYSENQNRLYALQSHSEHP